LVRFYGGDPLRWLTGIPSALVRAHLIMLPRLRADESLLSMQRTALGSGTMKSGPAHALAAAWVREVRGDGGHEIRPRPSLRALAAIGIGYRGKAKR